MGDFQIDNSRRVRSGYRPTSRNWTKGRSRRMAVSCKEPDSAL